MGHICKIRNVNRKGFLFRYKKKKKNHEKFKQVQVFIEESHNLFLVHRSVLYE